jgi:hypothetical protein
VVVVVVVTVVVTVVVVLVESPYGLQVSIMVKPAI